MYLLENKSSGKRGFEPPTPLVPNQVLGQLKQRLLHRTGLVQFAFLDNVLIPGQRKMATLTTGICAEITG